ncbi:hypothetical protein KAK05_00285 [Candidatus Parcubacteria bacterium]|nr:hypothetical protein [Candidatus Parcubacteria bacterium]
MEELLMPRTRNWITKKLLSRKKRNDKKIYKIVRKIMHLLKEEIEEEIIKIGRTGSFPVYYEEKIYDIQILRFSETSIKYSILGKEIVFSEESLNEFRKVIQINKEPFVKSNVIPALAC